MRLRRLHRWDLRPAEARRLQERLRSRVRLEPLPRLPRLVAGADCSFDPLRRRIFAGVILYRLPDLAELERAWASAPLRFPYVPGLLSFREAPALLAAFRKLSRRPDAAVLDSHGLAHPRRLGEASHVGLWLDLPTVGIAKSVLVGDFREPASRSGSRTPLVHEGEQLGWALRAADGARPVFVSPGHRADLRGALALALALRDGHRVPKPTREADRWVARLKREA